MLHIIKNLFFIIVPAAALIACPPTTQAGCNVTRTNVAQCGTAGYLNNASPLYYAPCITATFNTCRDNCLSDSTCKSFAWSGNRNDPYCYMFSKVTADMSFDPNISGNMHYNRDCFASACPIVRNPGFEMGPIEVALSPTEYPQGRWYHDPNQANSAVCNRFTLASNRQYVFDCIGNGRDQKAPCKNIAVPFTNGGDYVLRCLMGPDGFMTVSQPLIGLVPNSRYQATFALAFVNSNSNDDLWTMQLADINIVRLNQPCSLQGGKLCSSPNSATLKWQRWTANFTTGDSVTGYDGILRASSGSDFDGADFYLDNVQLKRL